MREKNSVLISGIGIKHINVAALSWLNIEFRAHTKWKEKFTEYFRERAKQRKTIRNFKRRLFADA